jgi:hypothetical protein
VSTSTENETGVAVAAGAAAGTAAGVEVADCVHCGEPTEYPAATRGVTLCPVCEWQEAQRTACSG